MRKDKDQTHSDPVSFVGPYARVRIVVAVILFLFAFAAISYRSFFG